MTIDFLQWMLKYFFLNENYEYKQTGKKMADIKINKSHSLEINDAQKRLEKMADQLQSEYGIKSAWTGNTAILSGTGLKKGVVELTDSEIKLEITLGLLAKALKGKIQEQVNTCLDEALS